MTLKAGSANSYSIVCRWFLQHLSPWLHQLRHAQPHYFAIGQLPTDDTTQAPAIIRPHGRARRAYSALLWMLRMSGRRGRRCRPTNRSTAIFLLLRCRGRFRNFRRLPGIARRRVQCHLLLRLIPVAKRLGASRCASLDLSVVSVVPVSHIVHGKSDKAVGLDAQNTFTARVTDCAVQ
eukprot:COSAG02_NODE_513_length_20826_cov_323.015246_23_plen_178_part_00